MKNKKTTKMMPFDAKSLDQAKLFYQGLSILEDDDVDGLFKVMRRLFETIDEVGRSYDDPGEGAAKVLALHFSAIFHIAGRAAKFVEEDLDPNATETILREMSEAISPDLKNSPLLEALKLASRGRLDSLDG
jgi:hypothetical protein